MLSLHDHIDHGLGRCWSKHGAHIDEHIEHAETAVAFLFILRVVYMRPTRAVVAFEKTCA